jgi:hypothetical protein
MSMNSYPGQPLPSSTLYSESTLSTAGQSTYDLRPSDPPSNHPTPYTRQSRVTQSPPQGSQPMPDMIEQSVYSTEPSNPIANHLTT